MNAKIKPLAYATLLAAPLLAQEAPAQRIEAGFNAAEIAQASTPQSRWLGDTRLRLMDDVTVHAGPVDVLVREFNDVNVRGAPFHLGRHSASLSLSAKEHPKLSKLGALVAVHTTQDGYQDAKIGARYDLTGVGGKGAYGYSDIARTVHGQIAPDAASGWDSWTLYGREFRIPLLDKKSANKLELFNEATRPDSGKVTGYSEIQYLRALGHGLEAFARAEVPNYNFRKASYLGGVRYDTTRALGGAARQVGRVFGRR